MEGRPLGGKLVRRLLGELLGGGKLARMPQAVGEGDRAR
jgi:hypothetical protein